MAKNSAYPKVGEKVEPGEIDERCLSGPVKTYFMTPEEITVKYGPLEPHKEVQQFNVGWPECGQPNQKHIAKQALKEAGLFTEEDYTDPEWKY
jgi:hypothetical protein